MDPIELIRERRDLARRRQAEQAVLALELTDILFTLGVETEDGEPLLDDAAADPEDAPAGKAEPAGAVRRPVTRDGGPTASQLAAARLVAEKGPMQTVEIRVALGLSAEPTYRAVCKNPLLEKSGPGKFDPYRLSAAGRAMTAGPTPAT